MKKNRPIELCKLIILRIQYGISESFIFENEEQIDSFYNALTEGKNKLKATD